MSARPVLRTQQGAEQAQTRTSWWGGPTVHQLTCLKLCYLFIRAQKTRKCYGREKRTEDLYLRWGRKQKTGRESRMGKGRATARAPRRAGVWGPRSVRRNPVGPELLGAPKAAAHPSTSSYTLGRASSLGTSVFSSVKYRDWDQPHWLFETIMKMLEILNRDMQTCLYHLPDLLHQNVSWVLLGADGALRFGFLLPSEYWMICKHTFESLGPQEDATELWPSTVSPSHWSFQCWWQGLA